MPAVDADQHAAAEDHLPDGTTTALPGDADSPAPDAPLAPVEVDDLKAGIQSLSDDTEAAASGPESDRDSVADATPRVSAADDSYYWEPSTMAPLNARSAAAIARLRAFRTPPFPLWDRLPLNRRAAVLVLLYADRRGDLRVVLTMRAASLRNYSGHAAFPGGKADSLEETPEQIARREAWEEIGLPLDDARLPRPFRIEHLCSLPYNLAKTELVVRPCIALLHAGEGDAGRSPGALAGPAAGGAGGEATPDEVLIPRLDAKEVAAVFSAPFHNFLLPTDEIAQDDGTPLALLAQLRPKSGSGETPRRRPKLPPGPWYEGSWIHWHEQPWRMHFFYVPVVGQRVAKPRKRIRGGGADESSASSEAIDKKKPAASAATPPPGAVAEKEDEQKDQDDEAAEAAEADEADAIEESPGRYKVWGMTARIIVDAAMVAYGETPAFEHNSHFGDERVIEGLEKMGRLGEKKAAGSELTHEDLKEASKM